MGNLAVAGAGEVLRGQEYDRRPLLFVDSGGTATIIVFHCRRVLQEGVKDYIQIMNTLHLNKL